MNRELGSTQIRIKIFSKFSSGENTNTEPYVDGEEGSLIEIRQRTCSFGRKDSDITIFDRHCSRKHALLYLTPHGDLRIRDLGSLNGTRVSGARVSDVCVRVGDVVRIGKSYIKVLDYGGHPTQARVSCKLELETRD